MLIRDCPLGNSVKKRKMAAASMSSFDVAKNAERLAAYFWVDKSPQELSETFKQFLEPFSKDDRKRIINCKLERYNGRTVVHVAAYKGLHLCLGEFLREGGDPNRESSAADLKQVRRVSYHRLCGLAICVFMPSI